jgi:hypothetical protein
MLPFIQIQDPIEKPDDFEIKITQTKIGVLSYVFLRK